MKKLNFAQKCFLGNIENIFSWQWSEEVTEKVTRIVVNHPRLAIALFFTSLPLDLLCCIINAPVTLLSNTIKNIAEVDDEDYEEYVKKGA